MTSAAVPQGIVISVFRGGCEVACGDRVHEVRLIGRHALREVALAVGELHGYWLVHRYSFVLRAGRRFAWLRSITCPIT